jgi:hypothetical protein
LADPDVTGRWPADPPAGFVLTDLGVVTTDAGLTEPLSLSVDAETRALHVIGISHSGTFVLLMDAQAPDGTSWVSPEPAEPVSPELDRYLGGFPGPGLSPNKVVPRPRAAAALLPNTPALALQPGLWTFRLGVHRLHYDGLAAQYDNEPLDAAVRVGVLERRFDAPVQGQVDLTLTFATGGSTSVGAVDASTAPDDPVLQQALSFIDQSLGLVGIELGDVFYQDGPQVEPIVDLGGPSCLGGPDVERAFDAAPEPHPGSLQVLFITTFRCESGGIDIGPLFGGIANGLPGRPLATRDGLVLSSLAMHSVADVWEKVLAHEMGHFFGLFHTCEDPSLGACDNIADTPEAPLAVANIMYPDVSQVTDFVFTPEQGEVMRSSPLVQPLP